MSAVNIEHAHRGVCPCCGTDTARTSGEVEVDGQKVARYLIKWTVGDPTHGMGWLISMKSPETTSDVCIKVEYSFEHESFMVRHREEDLGWTEEDMEGFGRLLDRTEVIGTPVASKLFEVLDDIWLSDPYVIEFVAATHGEQESE